MAITFSPINNADDYLDLVQNFSYLVDQEMLKAEQYLAEGNWPELRGRLMPLISLVNTIGYLRGQDGVFLDFRPQTDRQSDLYANEDQFEARLKQLILGVLSSDQAEAYRSELQLYYSKARTPELNS